MRSKRKVADGAYARFAAAKGELLRAVADLAESEGWRGDGAATFASWLAARWQISLLTARALVRDAEELRARPALQAALCEGGLSIEQARAVATLSRAGTDDDAVWLEALPFWSYAELDREARKARVRVLERRDGGIYFRTRHTPDERFLRGEFQLHPEDGAALLQAVEARIPDGTRLRDWDRASAQALVELVKGAVGPHATVLLSVDAASLATGDGAAAVGPGGYVGAGTAQRLACDGRIQTLYKDADGRLERIGRTARIVPPWMRRAVLDRDGGTCTFPGCGCTRYLQMHHIVKWPEGPTVPSNIISTCWTHHEAVHEGGWLLQGEAGPNITWVRPDGTPFESRVRVTLDTS
jgi:hypothetical protein